MARITKGSPEARARALKAAETRRRNRGGKAAAPPFPTSYHATPTRQVTRDLQLKYRVKKPKQARLSVRGVKKASNDELRHAYHEMNSAQWVWGTGDDTRYYAIKDELRLRANPKLRTYLEEHPSRGKKKAADAREQRLGAHRARRGVKKQRGAK